MFLGKHPRSLDAKGRLAIPAKFREGLPTGSVITIGPDGALRVYPPQEWDRVTENLVLSEVSDADERAMVRRLFSEATEIEYDGQGRVLVPVNLREQAGIGSSAVVTGANNVVEIWSEARWQGIESDTSDFTSLADKVARSRKHQV
jgi:MraZ protein